MANSVKFDGTEILNTTYIPRFVQHESAPDRELLTVPLSGDDGEIIVHSFYRKKRIQLSGILTAATESALETAIDSFKELFARTNKYLDISWAGSTRRYVASCSQHNFNRDHFHLLFVPWSAEFVVVSGVGQDTASTLVEVVTQSAAASPLTFSGLSFGGSANPKPHNLVVGTTSNLGDVKGIAVENTATGEKIVATNSSINWLSTEAFFIDCENKRVRFGSYAAPVDTKFYGVFPTFVVGQNELKIWYGEIPDQAYEPTSSVGSQIRAGSYPAQGFTVPYTDDTYQTIELYIRKDGTPPNALTITIVEDANGEPDETSPVTNASFSIAEADINVTNSWVKAYSTNMFTLKANTRYWMVIKTTAGDLSNMYIMNYDADGLYKRGGAATTSDAGSTWDLHPLRNYGFRLMYGGKKESGAVGVGPAISYYKRYL